MALPLLSTKTYLPQPVMGWVERLRLLERLNDAVHTRSRFILISAMAGSGKSTLLADWAASTALSFAWVSLDAHDNSPISFWAYLIASIQRQSPGFAKPLLDELLSPQPPQEQAILTELINQAESLTPTVLVLDDYHLIENPSIHESLVYLIEHLPETIILAVCTRSDPPMPLSRWRVRGYLTEIRLADLRFNHAEAADFFRNFSGLQLDDGDMEQLEKSTEGWAAGLQLAALALQNSAAQQTAEDYKSRIHRFSANHQYVVDYLTSEVLGQLPPVTQDFLLKTSILNQLSGSLCQSVTGNPDSAFMLNDLQKKNLFIIPLDDEGTWFRYHHLFADMLRIRLASQGADQINKLHLLAAQWYEQSRRMDDFLFHALQARAYSYAADVINRNWRRASDEGWPNQAIIWFKSLPSEVVNQHPMLSMAYAWTEWLRGQAAAAIEHGEYALQAQKTWLGTAQAPVGDYEFDTIPCQVSALRALVAVRQRRLEDGVQYALNAIEISKNQNPFATGLAWMALATALRDLGKIRDAIEAYAKALKPLQASGNRITVTNSSYNLGRLYQIQGRLDEAEQFFHSALSGVNQIGRTPADGILLIGLGEIAYDRNELIQAAEFLDQAFSQANRSGYLELIKNGRILRARLQRAAGDLDAALTTLYEAREILSRTDAQNLLSETEAVIAVFQAENGQKKAALQWFQSALPTLTDDSLSISSAFLRLNHARVQLVCGEAEEIAIKLRPFIESSRLAGCHHWQVEALVLSAMSWHQKGDMPPAKAALLEALSLAQPQKMVRVFLDGSPFMDDLLRLTYTEIKSPEISQFAAQILEFLQESYNQILTARQSAGDALIESLSEREIQVLRLLSLGLTNKDISDQLVISIPTTKTHVRHIFEKLNVQNRVEAINRSKELGIL